MDHFARPENQALVEDLLHLGLRPPAPQAPASKVAKAQELGVALLNEAQFCALLNN